MKTKYLNNAGAGIMSDATVLSMYEYIKLETEIGGYQAANNKKEVIDQFYEYSARLLNAADKSEIAFVDSASRGWNLAFYGIELSKGDKIVTLQSEYGTNLITIYDRAFKNQCNVKTIPCNVDGSFSLEVLENELKQGAKVLAVSHVTAQGSIINPVIEMGELAKKYGVLYVVDGCQAAGQMHIDVQKIKCDAYITAGRKWLRGPRGTGILYVKNGAPIAPTQFDLASTDLVFNDQRNVIGLKVIKTAKRFELWEKNFAAIVGLTNALQEYLEAEEAINNQIYYKANRIRAAVNDNQKLQLIGQSYSSCGIVGFYLQDPIYEQEVKSVFDNSNITYSLICDWDCPCSFPDNGAHFIFRFSPHSFTDDNIIDELVTIIKKL